MTHQQTYSYPPTDPDQPDRVTSDPVPVPPPAEDRATEDRASEDRDETDVAGAEDTPAEDVTDRVPEESLDDQGTFEDPVLSEERTDPDDLTAVTPNQDGEVTDTGADRDEPEFHEPAAQPTAFGAATVGGAAAAAAMAGPSRDATDERERDATDERDAFDKRDTFDERDAVDERDATDERDAFDERGEGAAIEDEPVAEEDRSVDADRVDADRVDAAPPAAIAEPQTEIAEPHAEMLPGDVPAEPVTALWGDDTAQSFRDRWRDVQLRFVDDPQGAARDAQSLVDDAVQSLTTALTSQRDELGGWSSTDGNDTEQYRVAVRQYRDFLDRLLGL
ncbi:hypothetical protein [Phytohabitans aurantiacus]|uniref:Uncharacterized protein n=1 Tax=Phytohabitans aurantiacus TaxID=3016789 RepID=A0ABQ5QZW1_9ACTN|nr:hypothetical protein [Phytohabitans aurantiacus]GLI00031.1 hypothetical protein Pa4123_53070 [Phytohabitans aurantiacus]